MNPPLQARPLAGQAWFVNLLAAKGFRRASNDSFTNGKASIELRGTHLTVDPRTGEKTWNVDLTGANRQNAELIIDAILKAPVFRSAADIARGRAEKERLKHALAGIAATIRQGPDTGSGVQLRRFLWSLYNQHHLVNLWQMTAPLDSKRAAWVSEVLASTFTGGLQEDDIKRTLLAAGEMERWDIAQTSSETLERFEEAERTIESLVRTVPPSSAHTKLVRLLREFTEMKAVLKQSCDTTA
jgi:hypothetical protein